MVSFILRIGGVGLSVGFLFGVALGALCSLSTCARARDAGQWANSPPHIQEWFKSLKDGDGGSCCDTADGESAEWDMKDGKYRVRIEGAWRVVEDNQLLLQPNLVGRPIVWLYKDVEMKTQIRCFLPGAGL